MNVVTATQLGSRLLSTLLDRPIIVKNAWIKGVVLTLVGSAMSSLGYCLQNLSQKSNLDRDVVQQRPAHRQILNWVGILFTMGEAVFDTIALAFASESMLASIGLSTLVFNLWLSPHINGEVVSPRDWLVCALIISGISITIAACDHHYVLWSMQDMGRLLGNRTFHGFVICTGVWLFALLYCTISLDRHSTAFPTARWLTPSLRADMHRFCLSTLAGTVGGLTVIMAKFSVEIIQDALIRRQTDGLWNSASFVVFALTITLAVLQVVCMNAALGLYHNLFVIPIHSFFLMLFSTFGGIFFYQENTASSGIRIMLILFGLALSSTGLIVLLRCNGNLKSNYGDNKSESTPLLSKSMFYDQS